MYIGIRVICWLSQIEIYLQSIWAKMLVSQWQQCRLFGPVTVTGKRKTDDWKEATHKFWLCIYIKEYIPLIYQNTHKFSATFNYEIKIKIWYYNLKWRFLILLSYDINLSNIAKHNIIHVSKQAFMMSMLTMLLHIWGKKIYLPFWSQNMVGKM